MASAMDIETLPIKRDFLLKKDDGGEELNGELELSLDLSLGGSIGKSKEKRKEDPCLKKYPSENVQPCLRKFASGNFDKFGDESRDKSSPGIDIDSGRAEIWKNLHGNRPFGGATSGHPPLSRSQSGAVTFEEAKPLVLPNGSSVKAAWPNQYMINNTSVPTMVQIGTGHPRILRTCSVGALGAGFLVPPPNSVLHRQPSLDVVLPDRKQEGVQSAMQKEVLEQQRKREMHALRRQEARKKREEKKARRDEGKSLDNKASVSFPISSSAIPSSNKWMLNPEPSPTAQSLTQMNPREGKSKPKPKTLLETQRSLKRDRERAARENEPWIENEKRLKRKGSRNGSVDPLPCDFEMGSQLGVPDPTETSKLMDKKANGNHFASTRTNSSPVRGHSTWNSNSPVRGNSGSEERNSKDLSENGHKSSGSNVEEGESARSRSQSTSCEASASGPYTGPAFSVLPIPYPFPMTGANGQCMPPPIGFSFPYMMPYWTPATQPTGSEPSKPDVPHVFNVIEPVSAHGLPTSQMPIQGTLPSWLSVPQAMGAPASVQSSVQNSHASGGSLCRSSSTIPDQDSKSTEGTSSDETKSQSSKSAELSWKGVGSLPRFPSINKAQGQILSSSEVSASHKSEPAQFRDPGERTPCTSAQSDSEIPSSKTSQEKTTESPSKKSSHFVSDLNEKKQNSSSHSAPDCNQTKQTAQDSTNEKPDQDNNSSSKPGSCSQLGNGLLQTLHRVTTTGVGPKGITISGILSYSSNQVKIVCVCHGTQMSPAEFVQHAGSTDISNPERNIVVTPMPVIIPATSAQG